MRERERASETEQQTDRQTDRLTDRAIVQDVVTNLREFPLDAVEYYRSLRQC